MKESSYQYLAIKSVQSHVDLYYYVGSTSSGGVFDESIMGRLYNSLLKECRKNKPSTNVINAYLNQEFKSRRAHIESMSVEERCSTLFELYPCFKNPVEVRLTFEPAECCKSYVRVKSCYM